MKLNSKYFDSIRVAPRREREEREGAARSRLPDCQWKGCQEKAQHKAPMGRGRDGEYYHFCMDHVRQYNASYNYFDGMSDNEVASFLKEAATGHRPTWKVGANGSAPGIDQAAYADRIGQKSRIRDPHGVLSQNRAAKGAEGKKARRQLRPLEKKAFAALDLRHEAEKDEIKARFKALVKLHHPDANGGDRRSEEKLREIIQAYNYLKQVGLV
jgi:DnaJ domain